MFISWITLCFDVNFVSTCLYLMHQESWLGENNLVFVLAIFLRRFWESEIFLLVFCCVSYVLRVHDFEILSKIH